MPGVFPSHVRLLDASAPGYEGPIDKFAFEIVLARRLRADDLVLCVAGDVIPASGVVVEGVAVIEEAGAPTWPLSRQAFIGPGMAIQGGIRVCSDYLVFRVTPIVDRRQTSR